MKVKAIIIAICMILIGGMIFVGVMTSLNWDFKRLQNTQFKTYEHTVEEEYTNISIVTDESDIVFLPSEDGSTRVVCCDAKNVEHSVSVKDGTLVIEVEDTRKWYDYLVVDFGNRESITVYLPAGEYGNLSIITTTGNVEIPQEFKFANINIEGNTCDVVNCASAIGNIMIHTSTGDITVKNITAGSMDLSVGTGSVNLSDAACGSLVIHGNTGDVSLTRTVASDSLHIEANTGDVHLAACDASSIVIRVNTGDVTGSLLTGKMFNVSTSTGKINIPASVSGGMCEIKTNTGDINVVLSQ